ncbi:MAG: radical SAM protein [Candidatus Latescibacteria bacterium]|nr:radical SAM protein [Candidatus Latescibacterota bacterium]
MEIIYQPKGRAREYAFKALNYYKGCQHRCLYCYCPLFLKQHKNKYFNAPNIKSNVIQRVQKDAQYLHLVHNDEEILISFIGDPYQPAEMELKLTRKVIEILIQNYLRFTILTKGGTRAERDFDLLANYSKSRFGTSLVFTDQNDADFWEPNAASINDRIQSIKTKHNMGIPTWISIEPVIKPDQALHLIINLQPFVDHWKIGKINYNKEIENRVNWIEFREEVKELLESLGADYYLKRSLTEL